MPARMARMSSASGRFFAGGMDDKEELKICGLWRLDPDLRVTKVEGGIICTNGPCWSPDNKTFYLADSFQGEIWSYDYDMGRGTLSNKRVFASFRNDPGVADGSTVDEEGCLWNAQVISGDLIRYAPRPDINIWMDAGCFEWLLEGNRKMVNLLRKREYQVKFREFPGGHNYTAWRNDISHGLKKLFGK